MSNIPIMIVGYCLTNYIPIEWLLCPKGEREWIVEGPSCARIFSDDYY